jgi:glycosyltransferase involved in cell wall biosynthesis
MTRLANKKSILFISTMVSSPWGGSEELWAGAALRLAQAGINVAASVRKWSPLPKKIEQLASAGVDIQLRENLSPLWKRAWRSIAARDKTQDELDMLEVLAAHNPALVVLCDGNCTAPITILQYCVTLELPFVTIGHMGSEYFGIEDAAAAYYRKFTPLARRCYFVSQANLKLFEKQIGCALPNAEVIRNPFNVNYHVTLPWPPLSEGDDLRLACVGRLHPPSKGQDILLEAFADPIWQTRNWHLTLYGDGPMRDVIEKLILRFKLSERVSFGGFVDSIERIWSENHVLLMPSRYEGLPLAIIEAMLCERPVLATDVAGHTEVIEDGVTGFIAEFPTVRSVGQALERLWLRRDDLKRIGTLAGSAIRRYVPEDPVAVFVGKLKAIADLN